MRANVKFVLYKGEFRVDTTTRLSDFKKWIKEGAVITEGKITKYPTLEDTTTEILFTLEKIGGGKNGSNKLLQIR
jgi:hypothetical protein